MALGKQFMKSFRLTSSRMGRDNNFASLYYTAHNHTWKYGVRIVTQFLVVNTDLKYI